MFSGKSLNAIKITVDYITPYRTYYISLLHGEVETNVLIRFEFDGSEDGPRLVHELAVQAIVERELKFLE